ncbi:bestrophin family ion channel [Adhaeribacter pallidiroseus]|nr:bestrophin family ion channel [Adhaeribacter pallidiroseus]
MARVCVAGNSTALGGFVAAFVFNCVLTGQLFEYKILLNTTPFTLIGLALAIFLGFRNNASYDRFW